MNERINPDAIPDPSTGPGPDSSPRTRTHSAPGTSGSSDGHHTRTVRFEAVSASVDAAISTMIGDITVSAGEAGEIRAELSTRSGLAREVAEQAAVTFEDGRLRIDVPQGQSRSKQYFGLGSIVDGFRNASDADGDGSVGIGDRLRSGWDGVKYVTGSDARVDIRLVVPAGTRVKATTGSGDVRVDARLGTAELKTGNGDVHLDASADARVTTGNGDIHVGQAEGDVTARSGNGDIRIGVLSGTLDASSGRGDLRIDRAEQGMADLRSGMGDVQVGVPAGTAVHLNLKTGMGDKRVDLDPVPGEPESGRRLKVKAASGMGDLRVSRAR